MKRSIYKPEWGLDFRIKTTLKGLKLNSPESRLRAMKHIIYNPEWG
jgi:hypothetical protein